MAFMHSNNTNLITLNNFYDLIDNELLNGYIIENCDSLSNWRKSLFASHDLHIEYW